MFFFVLIIRGWLKMSPAIFYFFEGNIIYFINFNLDVYELSLFVADNYELLLVSDDFKNVLAKVFDDSDSLEGSWCSGL